MLLFFQPTDRSRAQCFGEVFPKVPNQIIFKCIPHIHFSKVIMMLHLLNQYNFLANSDLLSPHMTKKEKSEFYERNIPFR